MANRTGCSYSKGAKQVVAKTRFGTDLTTATVTVSQKNLRTHRYAGKLFTEKSERLCRTVNERKRKKEKKKSVDAHLPRKSRAERKSAVNAVDHTNILQSKATGTFRQLGRNCLM